MPKQRQQAVVSGKIGEIRFEMVVRRGEETLFVVSEGGERRDEDFITTAHGERLTAYSPKNNLLTHGVVLFPSDIAPFGSAVKLVAEIRAFIHRYVDVDDLFEEIATFYVLLTWVFDAFGEMPYLRVRGDYGSGKSRFLRVAGSLCYRPIFASGTSSVSPLFRIMDSIGGTLVFDEGDFRLSDERTEIVKLLNTGHTKGFPLLRSEKSNTGEFNPRAFNVFGPKILATRHAFDDAALESRCITEELGGRTIRPEIPRSLPAAFEKEALAIRNKLLSYRFQSVDSVKLTVVKESADLEPRVCQIYLPLLSVVEDAEARARILEHARSASLRVSQDRAFCIETDVLEVLALLWENGERLTLSTIVRLFGRMHGAHYGGRISPRWMGRLLRKKLGLTLQKSNGEIIIPPSEYPRLKQKLASLEQSDESDQSANLRAKDGGYELA